MVVAAVHSQDTRSARNNKIGHTSSTFCSLAIAVSELIELMELTSDHARAFWAGAMDLQRWRMLVHGKKMEGFAGSVF